MDFSIIKNVDQRSMNLINGYIRSSQHLIKDKIIPQDVINLCVMYYVIAEFFVACGTSMVISSKAFKNDSIIGLVEAGWNTSYGKVIIDMNNTPNTIYRWMIEINSSKPSIMIGLVAVFNFRLTDLQSCISNAISHFYGYTGKRCEYYAWYPATGLFSNSASTKISASKKYEADIPQNCEIIMELNCKARTLRFIVDETDYGVAFGKVYRKQNYRFGISIGGNSTVQLSHFSATNA